jgi:cell division protein FtsW
MQLSTRHKPDFFLLFVVLLLTSIGLVMVFSASTVVAMQRFGYSSSYFFVRQLVWVGIGLVVMGFCMNIPFPVWYKLCKPALLFSLVSLTGVLFTHANAEYGGRRWFHVGPLQVQPSEYATISMILYIAFLVTKKGENLPNFKRGILPPLILITIAAGLIGIEPDLGTAVLLVGATFSILFVAGIPMRYVWGLLICGILFVAVMTSLYSFRMWRIASLLNPWNDPTGKSMQVIQSFIAINSGGLFGRGLGRSIEKFLYLPEPHTDFIFAILTEEWGWVGASFVLILFGILIWRGILICRTIENPFGAYTVVGITTWIGLGVIVNVGMVIGLLPVTGIPLPFISYGGTALVFRMAAVGIVLNISRYTRLAPSPRSTQDRPSFPTSMTGSFRPTVIPGKRSRFE